LACGQEDMLVGQIMSEEPILDADQVVQTWLANRSRALPESV
jgi:hypothetical protein